MVRDLCQGGQGVALVVGRAGTGKTFALGIARHAWQLDGYRLLAAAPTGIATLSLQGEGFEDVATCDRLLGDLDRGREQLDARTVLVVDEAGMVGSRKLARLLDHAQQAQAKVVLVGDDRQLAAIDAGGGFRALRLRLGASELTENRRQHQAWEREALELIRSGLVEEAVAAYQAHDRVVAADSKPAATLALLQDWWTAWQQADHDPAQEVIVLAARRTEVDRLNTRLPGVPGRPWPPRPRSAAGRGPPAGGRGPGRVWPQRHRRAGGGQRQPRHHHRPRPSGPNPDHPPGRQRRPGAHAASVAIWMAAARGERNRRVDLAYATTGHRAQGLTRGPGPGPAHRQRRRQLAVCAAVPGPPGHPPVRGGRARTPGRRRAGPARSGAARRLPAAGPCPVAGWWPEPGHRHPQHPRSPAAVHGGVAGRAGPAAPPARPGPSGSQPGAGPGHHPPRAGRGSPGRPPAVRRPPAGRHASLAAPRQRPTDSGAGWAGGGHPTG